MERNGWRAIIYDANWARFKTGQTGVIVSEDRRSCETIDDDKSNIIIVADPNLALEERDNGHVLFRQKGSDLFDIVCLLQDVGGTYALEVNNMTIDGCTGKDYGSFIRDLVIYEIINGERKQVTNYEDKKAMVVTPAASDASNNFKNAGDESITFPIKVAKAGISTEATLTSTAAGDEHEEYTNTEFDGLDQITITKESDGNVRYIISATEGNVDGKCKGGSVIFKANKQYESDPIYKISIESVIATEHFDVKKCGTTIETASHSVAVACQLVPKSGVSVIESGSNYLSISVTPGVSSVTVIVSTSRGVSREKTLQIPY